jgi:hypothetical protein
MPDAWGAGRRAGGAAEWRVAAWGARAGGGGAAAGGDGVGLAGQGVGTGDCLSKLRTSEPEPLLKCFAPLVVIVALILSFASA